MIDSTNPRAIADNIRHLSGESGSQASDLSALQSTVAAIGTYSTEEVNTGMKYGDSDIYRKCYYVEALPNSTTSTIDHGIENLEYLLDLRLATQRTGSYPGRIITYTQSLNLVLRSSDIAITSNADLSGVPGIIIIEYTKSAPSSLTSPAPDDLRSIDLEEIPDAEDEPIEPEVNEAPEEEPVVETKTTTRKKSTSTK